MSAVVLPSHEKLAVQSSHSPHLTFINSGKDVQLYVKTKYDLFHTWDQEFGIQATLFRYGNLAEGTNLCFDPKYPIRLDQKPRFSIGFQLSYLLVPSALKLAVYTKIKTIFGSVWKEESGVTFRLYTSPDLIISSNLAYIYNWGYSPRQKPQYVALVNFQFPLGR